MTRGTDGLLRFVGRDDEMIKSAGNRISPTEIEEAVLSGGETCADMALFGRVKQSFLKEFLTLEHGIPSHDTFYRVFARLDPNRFGECVAGWMAAVCEAAAAAPASVEPTFITTSGLRLVR